MSARSVWFALAVVLVPLAVVAGATAQVRMSAPSPPPSSLVLQASDFQAGGATGSQSSQTKRGETVFMRTFKPGARLSSTPLLMVESIALVEPDADTAAVAYSELAREARTVAGRKAIAGAFAGEFVKGFSSAARGKLKLTVRRSVVGAPVSLGEETLRLPMTLTTNLGSFRLAFGFGRVERVISVVVLMAQPNRPVSGSDVALAMSRTGNHVTNAFTVASTAPPTIAGFAAAGQTLTVDEGTWSGAPSRFDYSWSRCDPSGAACVPIDGASARTYVPTAADVGATLRAAIAGANELSSTQAMSAPTSVVS
jgi:hypothetical protein